MADLFVAPVSVEVLEAALDVGVTGLLCSEAQVPPSGEPGYGGIDYALLQAMHGGRDDVIVQRDHLRMHELTDTIIRSDAAHGFDAVMLHAWCVTDPFFAGALATARECGLDVEIGPGEDDSRLVSQALRDVPEWYASCPVGLRVQDLRNRGQFAGRPVVASQQFRAHNCDYLSVDQLKIVADACDGINLAPQLGTIQTDFYLSWACMNGLPIDHWVQACVLDADHIKKWCPTNGPRDAVRACGHYHYHHIPWRGRVHERVLAHLTKVLEAYVELVS